MTDPCAWHKHADFFKLEGMLYDLALPMRTNKKATKLLCCDLRITCDCITNVYAVDFPYDHAHVYQLRLEEQKNGSGPMVSNPPSN